MTQSKEWEKEFDKQFKLIDNKGFIRLPSYDDCSIIEQIKQFISSNFISKSEIERKIVELPITQTLNIHKLDGTVEHKYLIDKTELLNSLLNKEE